MRFWIEMFFMAAAAMLVAWAFLGVLFTLDAREKSKRRP